MGAAAAIWQPDHAVAAAVSNAICRFWSVPKLTGSRRQEAAVTLNLNETVQRGRAARPQRRCSVCMATRHAAAEPQGLQLCQQEQVGGLLPALHSAKRPCLDHSLPTGACRWLQQENSCVRSLSTDICIGGGHSSFQLCFQELQPLQHHPTHGISLADARPAHGTPTEG